MLAFFKKIKTNLKRIKDKLLTPKQTRWLIYTFLISGLRSLKEKNSIGRFLLSSSLPVKFFSELYTISLRLFFLKFVWNKLFKVSMWLFWKSQNFPPIKLLNNLIFILMRLVTKSLSFSLIGIWLFECFQKNSLIFPSMGWILIAFLRIAANSILSGRTPNYSDRAKIFELKLLKAFTVGNSSSWIIYQKNIDYLGEKLIPDLLVKGGIEDIIFDAKLSGSEGSLQISSAEMMLRNYPSLLSVMGDTIILVVPNQIDINSINSHTWRRQGSVFSVNINSIPFLIALKLLLILIFNFSLVIASII